MLSWKFFRFLVSGWYCKVALRFRQVFGFLLDELFGVFGLGDVDLQVFLDVLEFEKQLVLFLHHLVQDVYLGGVAVV